MRGHFKKINPVLLIIILCWLTRLPQLTSSELFLDSDECVVGLMAKHFMNGEDLSLFFWGQKYGFVLIEILFIVPFMAALGVKVIAVKLGMLTLWTIGVVFFYKALTAIQDNKRNALLITILLIAAPAWGLWSMKARGGYLTAFTFSTIVLYLLYDKRISSRNISYVVIGALTYLIYESQQLFLSGLIPLVIYGVANQKSSKKVVILFISTIVLWLLFRWYKSGIYVYYSIDAATIIWENLSEHIRHVPKIVYGSMHGIYHFNYAFEVQTFNAVFAYIFTAIFFLLPFVAIALLFTSKKKYRHFIFATAFVPITFLYCIYAPDISFRYALPVTGYALLAVYIYIKEWQLNKIHLASTYAIILIGVLGVVHFRKSQYHWAERVPLLSAISFLEKENIKYVYTADYTFSWDVMFNSNERILARNIHFPARLGRYDTLINKAYYRGDKTAILGHQDHRFGLHFDHYEMDSVYYISINPSPKELKRVFKLMDTTSILRKTPTVISQ